MKKITRIGFLLCLVLMLFVSMTLAAAAARPDSPGQSGDKANPPGGGVIKPQPAGDPYVYADDPGWVTDPKDGWELERYTSLPGPLTGEADLLVANDAGATATYTIPVGFTKVQLASSTYWTCGIAEVYVDGVLMKTVDLNTDTTTWGVVIYTTPGQLDPLTEHTVTIRATGLGGPGEVEIDGVIHDLSDWHFVNVQYLRYW